MPHALVLSYGIDGSYAFLLRDKTGAVRRQIVAPDVYNQYAVGDYFNDLAPRREYDGKSSEGKAVMTAMMSKVSQTRQIASARKTATDRQTAKAARMQKRNVQLAKQSRTAVKKQNAVRVAAVPAPRKALPVEKAIEPPPQILRQRPIWDSELAYVSLPRCR